MKQTENTRKIHETVKWCVNRETWRDEIERRRPRRRRRARPRNRRGSRRLAVWDDVHERSITCPFTRDDSRSFAMTV